MHNAKCYLQKDSFYPIQIIQLLILLQTWISVVNLGRITLNLFDEFGNISGIKTINDERSIKI